MKHLSLQQAMLGMRIIQTDHGMIIKSPAGSAEYDLKGRRIKVNGYPDYFPGQLRVKDKRTPKHATIDMSNGTLTVRDGDGTLRVQMGKVFISDASLQPFKIQSANIGSRIMSGQDSGWHLNKSGVLNAADEHDPVSLKICADKFQGNSLPFGGFPGASMNSAKNAADASATKLRLSEDMIEAVLDAFRNSDLFQDLEVQINAQASKYESALNSLQNSIEKSIADAIRNALRPGGLLFNHR